MSLVGTVVKGAVAGAAGTAAMDLCLYGRYRREGGKDGPWRWEFAGDVMGWDDASAPGQLGRKALPELTGHEPPEERARPTANIVHWVTGVGWGVAYGALACAAPQAKVYKPTWQYDARTLAKDLSAHLVYGAAVSVVFGGSRHQSAGRCGRRFMEARRELG